MTAAALPEAVRKAWRESGPHQDAFFFPDAVLILRSSAPYLLGLLRSCLRPLNPKEIVPPQSGGRLCRIEPVSACPDWADLVQGEPARRIEDDIFGRAFLYLFPWGAVFHQQGVGLIIRDQEGGYLLLVEDFEKSRDRAGSINLTNLANVVLSDLLAETGRLLIHAGGAGRNGQGFLWTGPSGAGKTTRILELVAQGWDFFGDDQVVLGRGADGLWRIEPFWRPIKADESVCARRPELKPLLGSSGFNGKIHFELDRYFPIERPDAVPLKRIFHLTPSGPEVPVRLSPDGALKTLSPSFLYLFRPGQASFLLESLLDLVDEIPVALASRDSRGDRSTLETDHGLF